MYIFVGVCGILDIEQNVMKKMVFLLVWCFAGLRVFSQADSCAYSVFGYYAEPEIRYVTGLDDGQVFRIWKEGDVYTLMLLPLSPEDDGGMSEFMVKVRADAPGRTHQYLGRATLSIAMLAGMPNVWSGRVVVRTDESLDAYLAGRDDEPSEVEELNPEECISFRFFNDAGGSDGVPLSGFYLRPYRSVSEEELRKIRQGMEAGRVAAKEQREEERLRVAGIWEACERSGVFRMIADSLRQCVERRLADDFFADVEKMVSVKGAEFFMEGPREERAIPGFGVVEIVQVDEGGEVRPVWAHACGNNFTEEVLFDAAAVWASDYGGGYLRQGKLVDDSRRGMWLYSLEGAMYALCEYDSRDSGNPLAMGEWRRGTFCVRVSKGGVEVVREYGGPSGNVPQEVLEWCRANIAERGRYVVAFVCGGGVTHCRMVWEVK